jgi:hypothetical protein
MMRVPSRARRPDRIKTRKTTKTRAVAALALGVFAVAVPGTSAFAAGRGVIESNTDWANVRVFPQVNSQLLGGASNGYQLTMLCWADGAWADGNYWTNRWFDVVVPYTNDGQTGFINASLVANQPSLPSCSSVGISW